MGKEIILKNVKKSDCSFLYELLSERKPTTVFILYENFDRIKVSLLMVTFNSYSLKKFL